MLSLFNDFTFQIVALGSAMLGIISGLVGSFAILRKQSLLGDALSHATLPGIALMFLITGTKNNLLLLLGALGSGLLAVSCIIAIKNNSKIKIDSALAIVMSVFFGIGMVLLTYIQKIPNANQAGLNRFIFGQASTMLKSDIWAMAILLIIVLIFILLFFKEIKLFTFNKDYMKSLGIKSDFISKGLSLFTVLAIIVGLQTVGVILMSSMLIAPGVAARQWTNKLSLILFLSSVFGAISGVFGTLISSSITKMPTGPIIVVIMSIIVFISMLFSPKRGIIWKKIKFKKVGEEIDDNH